MIGVTLTLASWSSEGSSEVIDSVQRVKDQWAEVFYLRPGDGQAASLEALLPQVQTLMARYPKAAEPLILGALVRCALAGAEGGLSALDQVKQAKELLIRAINLDPLAMEGSAYVILGNLYFRLPGWPISFGDDDLARMNLEIALKAFPNAMDTNYCYGDFLLEQGDYLHALPYLEKAEAAPVRPASRLSDLQLKQELKQILRQAREGHTEAGGFFSRFLSRLRSEPVR